MGTLLLKPVSNFVSTVYVKVDSFCSFFNETFRGQFKSLISCLKCIYGRNGFSWGVSRDLFSLTTESRFMNVVQIHSLASRDTKTVAFNIFFNKC